MEEQSFALIANSNTFFFFISSSISRSTFEYEGRIRSGTAACLRILTPVPLLVVDQQGRSQRRPVWDAAGPIPAAMLPSPARAAGGAMAEQSSHPTPHLGVAGARRSPEQLFG